MPHDDIVSHPKGHRECESNTLPTNQIGGHFCEGRHLLSLYPVCLLRRLYTVSLYPYPVLSATSAASFNNLLRAGSEARFDISLIFLAELSPFFESEM